MPFGTAYAPWIAVMCFKPFKKVMMKQFKKINLDIDLNTFIDDTIISGLS